MNLAHHKNLCDNHDISAFLGPHDVWLLNWMKWYSILGSNIFPIRYIHSSIDEWLCHHHCPKHHRQQVVSTQPPCSTTTIGDTAQNYLPHAWLTHAELAVFLPTPCITHLLTWFLAIGDSLLSIHIILNISLIIKENDRFRLRYKKGGVVVRTRGGWNHEIRRIDNKRKNCTSHLKDTSQVIAFTMSSTPLATPLTFIAVAQDNITSVFLKLDIINSSLVRRVRPLSNQRSAHTFSPCWTCSWLAQHCLCHHQHHLSHNMHWLPLTWCPPHGQHLWQTRSGRNCCTQAMSTSPVCQSHNLNLTNTLTWLQLILVNMELCHILSTGA